MAVSGSGKDIVSPITSQDCMILRKSDSNQRWIILGFNCVIMAAVYYTFDFPAPMKSIMNDYLGNQSDFETMYAFLYTIPAMPNIILPFLAVTLLTNWVQLSVW